jgi:hypothetical protein
MVTNTFAALRLLPVGDRDKDIEILALRHQIAVLERQLGGKKVRFTAYGCRKPTPPGDIRESRPRHDPAAGPGTDPDS